MDGARKRCDAWQSPVEEMRLAATRDVPSLSGVGAEAICQVVETSYDMDADGVPQAVSRLFGFGRTSEGTVNA
jgi:hypothetical protein